MAVEIQEVVDSQSVGGGYEVIHGNICLQGAGGADADDVEGAQIFPDFAGLEVDIGEGIQFVDDDVDIIGSDAGGEDGEAFGTDITGMGNEFAVLSLYLDAVKILADFADASGDRRR